MVEYNLHFVPNLKVLISKDKVNYGCSYTSIFDNEEIFLIFHCCKVPGEVKAPSTKVKEGKDTLFFYCQFFQLSGSAEKTTK